MASFFPMNWCNSQLGAKLSGKPASSHSHSSPVVEIPGASTFKRKRTVSPNPVPMSSAEWKKPRSVTDAQQPLPLDVASLPAKADSEQVDTASLAYATPGATPTTLSHRPDYLDSTHASMNITVEQPESSPSRTPSSMPPLNAPQHSEQQHDREDTAMEDASPCAEQKSGSMTALEQAIENQFNMQILMKHNELRLIDQEMAKCQVALEQLRRCELRPYPGDQKPTESVSAGTGPAVCPKAGYTKPSHAAPYGVTDGPYTRHYRQWLLADPQFDSLSIHASAAAEMTAQAAARSTRNSGSARKSTVKSVSSLHQYSDQAASLPSHPPAVAKKEKSGPLVLRRIADGKLVKLVCNDCNRGDMNSIQGFLNHCRIAHKVEYKSHEAAAVDCGRVLDEQEIATLPTETQATPAPKPATRHTPVRAPVVTSHVPAHAAVHPLNIPGASIPNSASVQSKKKLAATPAQPQVAPAAASTAPSSFIPSSQAPRLSALFAKHNVGGNLDQAITNAKQKVDIGLDEGMISPDASSPSTPFTSKGAASSSRGMFGASRPPSRKGYKPPTQRPRPSPLAPTLPHQAANTQHPEVPESPQDHPGSSLSPHTFDSEPGLISDMEDDDHGSASEEETTMLPASRGPVLPVARTCADADSMEMDVTVDDEIDEHGVVIRRNSMLGAEDRGLRTAGSPSRQMGGKGRVS